MDKLLEELRRGGSAADAVYAFLRNRIVSGELVPGERLRSAQLAKKLKVSRTPVRDALHKLEATGLVTALARSGLVVAELTEEDFIEAYQVLSALEGLAARMVAERATTSEVARLRVIFGEMETAVGSGDRETLRGLAREFLNFLQQATHNKRLQQIWKTLHDGTRQIPSSMQLPGRAAQVLSQFGSVLGAIETQNGSLAETSARQLRCTSLQVRLAMLREHPPNEKHTRPVSHLKRS